MGEFIEVSKMGELKDGVMKKVSITGRDVLVVRVGERFYATDNRCPHMGGDSITRNTDWNRCDLPSAPFSI